MFKNKKVIIILLVVLALIIGIVSGIFIYSKNSGKNKIKEKPKYTIVCDDLYANVKDSKRILKLNIVIETTDEKFKDILDSKKFLIRDRVNEIIVTKTEEELKEEKGQTMLKEQINAILEGKSLDTEVSEEEIFFDENETLNL